MTSAAAELAAAVQRLLPTGVACAVVPIGQGGLLAEEAALVAQAVPRRRAEFAAGRLALRQAFAAAGAALPPDMPILTRPDRRPDLLPGIAASLAHSGDLCIALATARGELALGVDLEPLDAARPEGLAETVHPFRFRAGTAEDPLLAFCAKEALFKRQFPLTGRMLDFTDIASVIGADGRFAACIAGFGFAQGRWLARAGYLVALSIGPQRFL